MIIPGDIVETATLRNKSGTVRPRTAIVRGHVGDFLYVCRVLSDQGGDTGVDVLLPAQGLRRLIDGADPDEAEEETDA